MEKRNLPNTTAVLILGIFSILTCCCWGVIGLIMGIIALVLAKKDQVLYEENPELYTNYSNLNTGKILAIIGIILSTIYLIYSIVLIKTVGMEGIMHMQQEMIKKYSSK